MCKRGDTCNNEHFSFKIFLLNPPPPLNKFWIRACSESLENNVKGEGESKSLVHMLLWEKQLSQNRGCGENTLPRRALWWKGVRLGDNQNESWN